MGPLTGLEKPLLTIFIPPSIITAAGAYTEAKTHDAKLKTISKIAQTTLLSLSIAAFLWSPTLALLFTAIPLSLKLISNFAKKKGYFQASHIFRVLDLSFMLALKITNVALLTFATVFAATTNPILFAMYFGSTALTVKGLYETNIKPLLKHA